MAWTVRQAGLDVPVLIFGCQEEETLTRKTPRRDAFCGLLSIGDVLRQIGAKYTRRPAADLLPLRCVVRGRPGLVRPRLPRGGGCAKRAATPRSAPGPTPFGPAATARNSSSGSAPTAVVLDLSEAIAGAKAMKDDDPEVQQLAAATAALRRHVGRSRPESLLRSAKLELFLRRFKVQNAIDAFAIQCWTSIQANYGVCSCAAMSRLGDEGVPCACEADILGTLSMHAALLASGRRPGWPIGTTCTTTTTNWPTSGIAGCFPQSFAKTKPKFGVQEIIASSGAAKYDRLARHCRVHRQARRPLTLCRVTQDPDAGWHAVVAEGRFEDSTAVTFGGYGWCRIPNLQRLYRDVLLRHFPHHVAITPGSRRQRALGGIWQLPRHERLSRHPGRAGAVHAAAAVLGPCRQSRQTLRRWALDHSGNPK